MKIYDEKLIEENMGLCIYVLRKERELSARQVGYILGKSECAVTAWERGEKNPSLNSVLKMCNIFSCTIEDFFRAHERIYKFKDQDDVFDNNVQRRNEAIFELHNKGVTMRKLADMYNITPEKVADICRKAQDNVDRQEDTLWQLICVQHKEEISLRVYNCLRRKGVHTKESLMNIIDDLICGNIQFSQFGKGCREYLQRIYENAS